MSRKRFTPEQVRALIVETREIESVFKNIYKGRVVEAKRRGNAKRPWLPQVDGYGVSPDLFTTSTFSSPKLALDCAIRFVDDQIGRISHLRQTSPKEAVADTQIHLKSAEKKLARARTPEAIEYSTALIRRLRSDLALANLAAMKIPTLREDG